LSISANRAATDCSSICTSSSNPISTSLEMERNVLATSFALATFCGL
jgi:hypothetical protein